TPNPAPTPTDVTAKTKGKNNGGKADRVTIRANKKAAGAKVRLYKVKNNRTGNKRVGRSRLGADGTATFVVKDTNGRKKTRYYARISGTDDTNPARSNKRGIR
ncbi:MAG: hypothetical protein WB471_07770, partial [Nocardioides sp.]